MIGDERVDVAVRVRLADATMDVENRAGSAEQETLARALGRSWIREEQRGAQRCGEKGILQSHRADLSCKRVRGNALSVSAILVLPELDGQSSVRLGKSCRGDSLAFPPPLTPV